MGLLVIRINARPPQRQQEIRRDKTSLLLGGLHNPCVSAKSLNYLQGCHPKDVYVPIARDVEHVVLLVQLYRVQPSPASKPRAEGQTARTPDPQPCLHRSSDLAQVAQSTAGLINSGSQAQRPDPVRGLQFKIHGTSWHAAQTRRSYSVCHQPSRHLGTRHHRRRSIATDLPCHPVRRRPTRSGRGFWLPGQGGAPNWRNDLDQGARFRVGIAWVGGGRDGPHPINPGP